MFCFKIRPHRTTTSNDCNSFANSNKGCGVLFSGPSYGSPFNLNRGGYYVASRSRDSGIRLWFWPRNSPNIPPKISQGGVSNGEQITPDATWGEPAANFPLNPGKCNYDQYFNAHKMIFDLTFCVRDFFSGPLSLLEHDSCVLPLLQGNWAGSQWASSGCGIGTCEDCECPLDHDGPFRNSFIPFASREQSPHLLSRGLLGNQ